MKKKFGTSGKVMLEKNFFQEVIGVAKDSSLGLHLRYDQYYKCWALYRSGPTTGLEFYSKLDKDLEAVEILGVGRFVGPSKKIKILKQLF